MQGIVKQATDSRYWDLWSRQKLASELELKRRNILKINQDLTNQLTEPERHFNSIELNIFEKKMMAAEFPTVRPGLMVVPALTVRV